MACSLSNLANNLAEETHKIKCKYGHDDKKAELNSKIASAFLNSLTLKMIANANANVYVEIRIIKKSLVEKLKERFFTTHEFSNDDNNKFILLLRKGVSRYKYID